MIAGPARITGIFLDLSPVLASTTQPRLSDIIDADRRAMFASPRILPEWGNIFSDSVLAIRPTTPDEVACALALAHQALELWLNAAKQQIAACDDRVRIGQSRYNESQRKNIHTYRALSNLVGEQQAQTFIDTILFETINPRSPQISPEPLESVA